MNNRENFNLYGKRQSTEANVEMTQILELSDKYFKIDVLKILKVPS